MKKPLQKALALALAFVLCLPAAAAVRTTEAAADLASYILRTVKAPAVGSTGGEWAVLGLARSGCEVPEGYYEAYYARVEDTLRENGGVLHDKKYTEYSRVILALSALGRDARDVAGYDLTKPLADYDKTIWQGLNGPIWALIALDSRNYPMPENPEAKTQATRQMYIDRILDCQLPDGGWSLLGGTAAAAGNESADPDLTGMALQALAKYQDQPKVAQATEEALACMSALQDGTGGFSAYGAKNVESCVQMICALCELGIPLDDARFVKNGATLEDNLLRFYTPGQGFRHTDGSAGDSQMSTEQGFYALVAIERFRKGENSLYRMGDAVSAGENAGGNAGTGLAGRHEDVKTVPVTAPGKTFADIADHPSRTAIEALAARGIVSGRGGGRFAPGDSMTRAEFAAIVVRALGLTPVSSDTFSDVPAGQWYAPYVGTASAYGIIKGVGGGQFNPGGTITRQEAAVMVARAAKLCGMDTAMEAGAVRDVLAQFSDYVQVPDWARPSLAFCYDAGILDDSALSIGGSAAIQRWEIAQMLYNLLGGARLL